MLFHWLNASDTHLRCIWNVTTKILQDFLFCDFKVTYIYLFSYLRIWVVAASRIWEMFKAASRICLLWISSCTLPVEMLLMWFIEINRLMLCRFLSWSLSFSQWFGRLIEQTSIVESFCKFFQCFFNLSQCKGINVMRLFRFLNVSCAFSPRFTPNVIILLHNLSYCSSDLSNLMRYFFAILPGIWSAGSVCTCLLYTSRCV